MKSVTKPQAVIWPFTDGQKSRSFKFTLVTKPQAVIWPFTVLILLSIVGIHSNKTASGNLAFHLKMTNEIKINNFKVTKPQAVIWPFTRKKQKAENEALKAG